MKLFSDREYTLDECPAALAGAQFLPIAMNGKKSLECSRPGVVYLLTPQPNRNRDSLSDSLVAQGFGKVRLPEVRLFGSSSPNNFCTLYQKVCQQGETVAVGKWAVPVFLP